MSRYTDNYDDDYSPEAILAQGRWERNSRAALKSKRGRKALAELRDALLALPEKRLIEGAVCTVNAEKRRTAHLEDEIRDWEEMAGNPYRPPEPWTDQTDEFARIAGREGEGCCAVGALVWYRKVQAGIDPGEAFSVLPDIAEEGTDGLDETARLAVHEAGLAYTLAWNLAYRNDETYGRLTPEDRYTAFLAWIDRELAEVPA
jgi:hypothetical protein